MRPSLIFGSFVIVCIGLIPAEVAGQLKTKEGKTTQATANDYSVLGRYSEVTAKLSSIDTGRGVIVIHIDNNHPVRNTNTNGQQPARRGKRPAGGISIQTDHTEYELPIKDKAPVRKMFFTSGGEFDEKGNPKAAPTAAEKAKLKGDPNLPGYIAQPDELVPNTVVKLKLEAPKKSSTAKKDEDPDLASRPSVKMIIAMSEPKDTTKPNNAPPRKKNN
jgi:hypothetical protein